MTTKTVHPVTVKPTRLRKGSTLYHMVMFGFEQRYSMDRIRFPGDLS